MTIVTIIILYLPTWSCTRRKTKRILQQCDVHPRYEIVQARCITLLFNSLLYISKHDVYYCIREVYTFINVKNLIYYGLPLNRFPIEVIELYSSGPTAIQLLPLCVRSIVTLSHGGVSSVIILHSRELVDTFFKTLISHYRRVTEEYHILFLLFTVISIQNVKLTIQHVIMVTCIRP